MVWYEIKLYRLENYSRPCLIIVYMDFCLCHKSLLNILISITVWYFVYMPVCIYVLHLLWQYLCEAYSSNIELLDKHYWKQNQERSKENPRWKVEQRHGKLQESGPNNRNTSKCPIETTHNSVKVKLRIKVMKLSESPIGWEFTVGGGLDFHLTFMRGLLHIAEYDPRIDHNTCWMTISSVLQGIPVCVAYWKVAWPSE